MCSKFNLGIICVYYFKGIHMETKLKKIARILKNKIFTKTSRGVLTLNKKQCSISLKSVHSLFKGEFVATELSNIALWETIARFQSMDENIYLNGGSWRDKQIEGVRVKGDSMVRVNTKDPIEPNYQPIRDNIIDGTVQYRKIAHLYPSIVTLMKNGDMFLDVRVALKLINIGDVKLSEEIYILLVEENLIISLSAMAQNCPKFVLFEMGILHHG